MEKLGFILLITVTYVRALSIYDIYGYGPYGYQPADVAISTGRREDFQFECPKGQVLNVFKSENPMSDRQWGFGCAHVEGVLDKCIYSDFLNVGDSIRNFFDFECPYHGALVGINTTYVNDFNERQYSFKCCATAVSVGKMEENKAYVRPAWYTECEEFEIVPELGGSFEVDIPKGFVCLRWRADTNVQSFGDRFHSLQCCRISFCTGCYQYSANPPYFDNGYLDPSPSYPVPSPTIPPQ